MGKWSRQAQAGLGFASVLVVVVALAVLWAPRVDRGVPDEADLARAAAASTTTTATAASTTTTITTTTPPFEGWVDPETSGRQWGDTIEGLLTFRGNPTRTYYGRGPVPATPDDGGMIGEPRHPHLLRPGSRARDP